MHTKYLHILISSFLVFITTQNGVSQADQNTRDLRLLTEWFEGEFDNDSQIWFQNGYSWKGNPEERHNQMHATHVRFKNDSIGHNVFYVEEYIDNDPHSISRQRIVSFTSLAPQAGIKMSIYFLNDAEKYLGSTSDSKLLAELTKDILFDLDGCSVIFQRNGEQYEGSMEHKACQFGEGDKKRYSVHDMVISENQYWRVDRTFLTSDDSFYKGHVTSEPHKMRKAKYYSCDIAYYETAYYIPSEKDKKYNNQLIHNQGGKQYFLNPINGKNYAIQLREKEYPYYEDGSDFFMLRFIEEGQKASSLIVTSSPNPPNISFQMGWVSANCKLVD